MIYPAQFSVKYEVWINLFLDMQVIKKKFFPWPFLRKFLEDILQQIQKINQKEKKNGIQERGNLAQERR